MFDLKIVAFLCTWCSYAGADLSGTGRNQYPPNIRVIRIPCSGRINPIYIIKALLEGADGVMVSGCHPGDCHYLVGNFHARRRFIILKKLLTTAGFDPDRVHFTWVSASEGIRFAEVVREVTEKVSALGQNKTDLPHKMALASPAAPANHMAPASPVGTTAPGRPPTYQKQQNDLIPLCRKLLENGEVNTIIGFQEGGEMGMSLPCIVTDPEGAEKLVWNDRCVPVLSGYLSDRKGKTAIVAKPCDARAVASLIRENQLKREDVYIIGLVCEGMKNDNDQLLQACLDCRTKSPPVYDVLIGDAETVKSNHEEPRQEPDESMERFLSEIDKCILCYSCRQSCYGCYCKTCFMERGEPNWQPAAPDREEKMLYHLGRTMHLAGRCVECGACENACASGVDIRYLIRGVTNFIEEMYDFRAGMDMETQSAVLEFDKEDLEVGFLGYAGGEDDA